MYQILSLGRGLVYIEDENVGVGDNKSFFFIFLLWSFLPLTLVFLGWV